MNLRGVDHGAGAVRKQAGDCAPKAGRGRGRNFGLILAGEERGVFAGAYAGESGRSGEGKRGVCHGRDCGASGLSPAQMDRLHLN